MYDKLALRNIFTLMGEENAIDVAVASLVAGILLSVFFLSKIGAVDFYLSDSKLPQIATPQMQMEATEVDHAQPDEPHPNRSESHAPANKSDILE